MSPFSRNYILVALEGNAKTFSHLLRDIPEDSPRWDAQVEPDRFTLREIIAHLCDYDSVTRERFEHIIRENAPELVEWDPGVAAEHYSARHPLHGLADLCESRAELAAWLRGLSENEWQRVGTRSRVGTYSVEEGAALLLGHDGYHMQQVCQWLDATAGK